MFAGVSLDSQGRAAPTATGRLCRWKEDPGQPADSHGSFGSYQRTLKLDCEAGQPGILQWTPDADTPDTVYYQVRGIERDINQNSLHCFIRSVKSAGT